MNRVTLCSNCRAKSREIIAYGEKLAAAEARLRESEEALRVACEALTAIKDSERGGDPMACVAIDALAEIGAGK